MTEEQIIDKVCDRMVNTMYNELDYYMFEYLWFEETNDEYVKYTNKLIKKTSTNLDSFSYNIIIASLHEANTFLNKELENSYSAKTLK